VPSEAARKQIEWAKRRLRRRHPTGWPVRVFWVPASVLAQEHECPIHADAAFHEGKGTIRLADGCSQEMAVENLIHEWAHLLRELVPVGSDRWLLHDAIYWAIYGTIIGAWHGE
jgi:hypothetical protein